MPGPALIAGPDRDLPKASFPDKADKGAFGRIRRPVIRHISMRNAVDLHKEFRISVDDGGIAARCYNYK